MKKVGGISPLAAILIIITIFFLSILLIPVYRLLGYGFAIIGGELLLMAIPLVYMLHKKVDIGQYVGLKINPKIVLLGVALGALVFLFNVVISSVFISILGTSEAIDRTNKIVTEMSRSLEGLVTLVIAMSLAGICEEFAFRGFLQTAISSKYPFSISLLASSLAFGVFHLDPQGLYIILAFIMGLVLGYIYHRWRSYVIAATTHITLNLIALIFTVLAA
jgi:membrane protease YdiL (CAAX protease family)